MPFPETKCVEHPRIHWQTPCKIAIVLGLTSFTQGREKKLLTSHIFTDELTSLVTLPYSGPASRYAFELDTYYPYFYREEQTIMGAEHGTSLNINLGVRTFLI